MKLYELMDVCRCVIELWNGDNDRYLGTDVRKYSNWQVMNITNSDYSIIAVIIERN